MYTPSQKPMSLQVHKHSVVLSENISPCGMYFFFLKKQVQPPQFRESGRNQIRSQPRWSNPAVKESTADYFIKQLICSSWVISCFPNLSCAIHPGGDRSPGS